MATKYVSSSEGDNGHPGTEAEPYLTFAYADSQISGGDTIKLKRGDIFREIMKPSKSGSIGAPTIIDAYGSGVRPIIMPAVDLSLTTSWADQGGNQWRAGAGYGLVPISLPIDVGALIFNNDDTNLGIFELPGDLPLDAIQGHYTYNDGSAYVAIYSVGNPGSVYSHIEAGTGEQVGGTYYGLIDNKNYITIKNISFKYNTWNSFYLTGGTHHLIIENCDFKVCGGSYWPAQGTRDGNGIIIWNNVSDIIIRDCWFDRVYETALSLQAGNVGSPYTQRRIYMYRNLFTNSCAAMDFWYQAGGTYTVSDIYFVNNVIHNTILREYPEGNSDPRAFTVNNNNASASNCFCLNNIFHTAEDHLGDANRAFISVPTGGATGWVIDYNCYYPSHTNAFVQVPNGYDNLIDWRAVTPYDDHSILQDPLFVLLGSDYHLQLGSGAIDTGTDTGLGLPYLGAGYDMGIYEYDASTPLIYTPFRKI